MRIACLQHVPFEGPAAIGSWAATRGFPIAITRLFADDPLPALSTFDLLVVLGGPMSVRNEDRFAWLRPEKEFIRQTIDADKYVLGVCLGAQLIADAQGAEVYPNREREIGWFPVDQTPQAAALPAMASLPATFSAMHWHGETFDLPHNSTWLARSEGCTHQAFSIGRRVLGFQFHLESTPESVEALLRNCPGDLAPGRFVQPARAILTAYDRFREANRLMAIVLEQFVSTEEQIRHP